MRVVGGNYRSRPLKAVPGQNTRPTTDKIKEAMFNLLSARMSFEGFCLDFYAGSGALAIEAVSRGMDGAVLCEKYRPAIETIRANIEMTKEKEKFQLLAGSNRQMLKSTPQFPSFQLIFLDPPYQGAQIIEDVIWLKEEDLIAPDAFIMCETDQDHVLPEHVDSEIILLKEKSYGLTHLWLYQNQEEG